MIPDYHTYGVEDFTRDRRFRQWVIQRDPQSEAFWVAWLANHPESAGKVQLARAFLYALEEKNTALPPQELADMASDISQPYATPVRSLWSVPALRIAAAIVMISGLGYFMWSRQSDSAAVAALSRISPALTTNYREIGNTGQEVRQLTLPDSSTVTLYATAKLRYPKQFAPNRREVYLTGKAFFDITKNPKSPFWVHTDQLSTQVFGTSFLVIAEQKNAKVEVRSGRVSVYTRNDIDLAQRLQQNESRGVVLTANQQAAFVEKEDRLVKSVVSEPVVLQPIKNRDYEFDETPIGKVFNQLEQTYGLPVMYDPATVEHCFITANLTDESLFKKLDLICRISHSTYEIVDGQIIIHSLGCDSQ